MDIFEINLQDCPVCNGPALLETENDWCVYVMCLDCGSQTAEMPFNSRDERKAAAQKAADLWNMGKVISPTPGS
jgi:hypothetical protein